MQVTKVTSEQLKQTIEKKTYTLEDLQNEYSYYLAQKLLIKLLEQSMISEDEFDKITKLNRKTFTPYLAEIMP